jgi:adenylate cyclase
MRKQETMGQSVDPAKPNRILVVDDELENLELLQAQLNRAGYVVELARGGQEALEKVAAHVPDLILLDVVMPKVNGFEICGLLKNNDKTRLVPVVMITGLEDKHYRIQALEVGADDFLKKPFDLYELLTRVRSLLRIKALHDRLERQNLLLHDVLNRYVAEDVTNLILHDPEKYLKLGGENRIVTVLFADIRGFTRFAERHTPTEVVEVLNLVFTALTQVVLQHGGTFDKYLGDAIMAFFGAPVSHHDDPLRAVNVAVDMQHVFQNIVEENVHRDIRELGLGIGLNTGETVVGNIGSEKLMDYTVIGDTANVAKRLQEIATKRQIIIGQTTYDAVREHVVVEELLQRNVEGRDDPIIYYNLKELIPSVQYA